MTFREFLNETIINLFDNDEKNKYIDEIWELLNKSYKSIGGLKESGFENKENMKKISNYGKYIETMVK